MTDLRPVVLRGRRSVAPDERAELGEVRLAIVDLPGDALAVTTSAGIAIDIDAAGHGWFLDVSSAGDAQFQIGPDSRWRARAGSGAEGRMDLATVLAHEIGHLLGRGELPFERLAGIRPMMADHLDAGERRLEVGDDAGADPTVLQALAAGGRFYIRAASASTDQPSAAEPAAEQPSAPAPTQPPAPVATTAPAVEPEAPQPSTTEPAGPPASVPADALDPDLPPVTEPPALPVSEPVVAVPPAESTTPDSTRPAKPGALRPGDSTRHPAQ